MSHEPFLALAVMALFWFAMTQRPATPSAPAGMEAHEDPADRLGRTAAVGSSKTEVILAQDGIGGEVETVQKSTLRPQLDCSVCAARNVLGGAAIEQNPDPTSERVTETVATSPVGTGRRR